MPLALPPVLVATLGLIGSFALARWLRSEARRANAALRPQPAEAVHEPPIGKLKRDPATGVYTPE
jgi:hypothetical protein